MDLDLELGNGNKYEKEVDFIRHDTMDPVRDQHYRDQLIKQATENQATIEEVNQLKRTYLRFVIISFYSLSLKDNKIKSEN